MPTKTKGRQQVKAPTKHRAVAVLFIIVFATVGSYLLFRSQAAIPDNNFRGAGGFVADYSVYSDTQNPNEHHAVGSTFKRNYYLHFSPGGAYPQGTHHLQFYIRWYTNEVKHLQNKFDCGDATPCVKVATPGYSESSELTNLIYCFEITPAMRSQGNVRLFSTEFQQISATNQNWFDDLLYLFSGECTGYYENGPPAQDANYLAFSTLGNGSLGNGIAGSDDGTSGSGTDTKGSGSGSRGSGAGTTGSGAGGSSGSTATKQGNKPNSTPSSSGQGHKAQTKLQPSPFYDGKQYQQGSNKDSNFGGLFSKPKTGGIATGWYLLVGVILLLSGGGYLWWRTHRE